MSSRFVRTSLQATACTLLLRLSLHLPEPEAFQDRAAEAGSRPKADWAGIRYNITMDRRSTAVVRAGLGANSRQQTSRRPTTSQINLIPHAFSPNIHVCQRQIQHQPTAKQPFTAILLAHATQEQLFDAVLKPSIRRQWLDPPVDDSRAKWSPDFPSSPPP